MNIQTFVAYLNKSKGWQIEGAYYSLITEWRDWWRGYYAPFHTVREMQLRGGACKRRMHSLRMPKRACEDWASLLLNDKTTLTVQDAATARWLLGEDAGQTGGLLAQLGFWPHANELVELAFRSGTGAFVLSVENMAVQNGQAVASPDARLALDYLPAECILPITIRHGQVIDAAFASEVTVEGKSCIYLQTHQLGRDGYRITNEYFTSQNEGTEDEGYTPAKLPRGMAAGFSTGSSVPWFSLLRPAGLKNRTGGPGLGQAVFAEAVDAAKMSAQGPRRPRRHGPLGRARRHPPAAVRPDAQERPRRPQRLARVQPRPAHRPERQGRAGRAGLFQLQVRAGHAPVQV